MKNFTSGIIHNNHFLQLYFHSVENNVGFYYYVTAVTQDAERISFDLKMDVKGNWNVVAPAPLWIRHLELQFNQLLNEHFRYKMVG
ncbi:MAG: hypothetical protein ACJ75F_15740 [Flavisolibacter sp.]|jgi:hypothetical protein